MWKSIGSIQFSVLVFKTKSNQTRVLNFDMRLAIQIRESKISLLVYEKYLWNMSGWVWSVCVCLRETEINALCWQGRNEGDRKKKRIAIYKRLTTRWEKETRGIKRLNSVLQGGIIVPVAKFFKVHHSLQWCNVQSDLYIKYTDIKKFVNDVTVQNSFYI